ncbi:putative six-bladed beta-propellerlike protein [Diplodia seriata]|uniref:Putative six-bladed beta-propellerlike protein n=1 Tax=Diplodia seriata TaxID=420778 RepID=A0A0G2GXH3_9PEZI|nr:putative six-bladed beta-propellerlike protein [Diplodia seriata]
MAADDISVFPVTQLPANSWFEGFAVRPNGHILATRLDAPELYTFDPADPSARPQLLHTFPDANGLVNLCPIKGGDDEYAVIAATVELQQVQFDSAVIWRVKLDETDTVQIAELARVPESGFCIGVTAVSPTTLAIADSQKNCIWRLDIATGKSSVLVADEATMAAASEEDYFGINRVRVSHGHLWYTNTSAGLLCRVPIDADGSATTGPVEIVASDLPHCDGLALTDDGAAIFTANYMAGVVWRVDVDPQTGKGASSILTRGLSSPTSVEFANIADKNRLYVTCCGGEGAAVGWVNEDDRASEQSKFNFEIEVTAEVTVTEEVVEERS